MNSPSSFDRDTLQQFLANAFAVQESQIASQSLSDIMDVQRSIARGQLDLDGAMNHIVESARHVADATGVAVALLKGDRLSYRAGSGISAAYVGQHVTASLTASANTRTSREILRVENALTDTRIEADVCRQFGANALLILPIYRDRALAGIIDVRFAAAHTFKESEVRAYRMMAEQIEAAMLQAAPLEADTFFGASSVSNGTASFDDFVPPPDFLMLPENEYSLYARGRAVFAAMRELPVLRQSASLAASITDRTKQANWPARWRASTVSTLTSISSRTRHSLARSMQKARTMDWPNQWRNSTAAAAARLSSAFQHSASRLAQHAKNSQWPNQSRITPANPSKVSTDFRHPRASAFQRSKASDQAMKWWNSAVSAASVSMAALKRSAALATKRAQTPSWNRQSHRIAFAVAAMALVFTSFILFRSRNSIKPLESSTVPSSSATESPSPLSKPLASQDALSVRPSDVSFTEEVPTTNALKRVRVGPNEIDYVGQDVTVRIFSDRPAIKRSPNHSMRIRHIGDDVTVRYFTPASPAEATTTTR